MTDGDAFDHQFRRELPRILPRLHRYARSLTHDLDQANDLVQTALVSGIANQRNFTPGTDLRAWLFTIIHNEWMDDRRRNRRAQSRINEMTVAARAVTHRNPAQYAWLELRELEQALVRLPTKQREIVLKIALENAKYEHVARSAKLPVGTVRSRLSRGRAALRQATGRQEPTEPVTDKVDRHVQPRRRLRQPQLG